MEKPKPRIFKIMDHQTDHDLVERAMPEALKNRAQLEVPQVRARFLRHYNRSRLALASKSPALSHWEACAPVAEPADSDLFANWLNTQSHKSMAIRGAPIINLKRPLVINMMIAPDDC